MARPRIFSDEERKQRDSNFHKIWYKKPGVKEERAAYAKKYKEEHPEAYMLSRAGTNARQRGLEFDLSIEDIVIPEFCPILDIKLVRTSGKPSGTTPSLDRVDNSKGYIKGNVRVISRRANQMKGDMSKEDIKRLWEYV